MTFSKKCIGHNYCRDAQQSNSDTIRTTESNNHFEAAAMHCAGYFAIGGRDIQFNNAVNMHKTPAKN